VIELRAIKQQIRTNLAHEKWLQDGIILYRLVVHLHAIVVVVQIFDFTVVLYPKFIFDGQMSRARGRRSG
jgi:hypothetical protein